MHTLTSKDWIFLSKLWADLADHHFTQIDEALEHMRSMLRHERGIYQMFGVFSAQGEPLSGDPLNGWRPVLVSHDSITPEPYIEIAQRWSQDIEHILRDEWLHILMIHHKS
jgi:hypothetical protein